MKISSYFSNQLQVKQLRYKLSLCCRSNECAQRKLFNSYLEFLFSVQQTLFLWSRAESGLYKILEILNCHVRLVRHHCAVSTQHNNRYRLIALQWRHLGMFRGCIRRGVFWKQVLESCYAFKVPWVTCADGLGALRTLLGLLNVLCHALWRHMNL